MRFRRQSAPHRGRAGYTIPEFGAALTLCIFVLLPIVNLVAFGCSSATAYLISSQVTSKCSLQTNFDDCLKVLVLESQRMHSSGLAISAKVRPAGGFGQSGFDCYLLSTNIFTNSTSTYGPNLALPPPIDCTASFYQLQTNSLHEIQPFLNLSALPFIGNAPIVGRPATVGFSNIRTIEHPEGFTGATQLANQPSGAGANQGTGPANNGNNNGGDPASSAAQSSSGWNFPSGVLIGAITAGIQESDQTSMAIGGNGGSGFIPGQGGAAFAPNGGVAQSGSSGIRTYNMNGTTFVLGNGISVNGGNANGGIAFGANATSNGEDSIAMGGVGGSGGQATASNGGKAIGGTGGNASASANGGNGGNATSTGGWAIGGNGGNGGNGVNGGNGGGATSSSPGQTVIGGNGADGNQGGANGASASN